MQEVIEKKIFFLNAEFIPLLNSSDSPHGECICKRQNKFVQDGTQKNRPLTCRHLQIHYAQLQLPVVTCSLKHHHHSWSVQSR